jgi:hypothetical protein
MRLYLDTCIANDAFVLISTTLQHPALHRRDVKAPIRNWLLDYVALYYLLDLDDQWDLTFGTSPIMSREIAQIEERCDTLVKKKGRLFDFFHMLEEKPLAIDRKFFPRGLIATFERIIPRHRGKAADVEHLAYAALGGWDAFITTDRKTILSHAVALRQAGLDVVSPLSFLESTFMPLEQLVRTLHGSWTGPGRPVPMLSSRGWQRLNRVLYRTGMH